MTSNKTFPTDVTVILKITNLSINDKNIFTTLYCINSTRLFSLSQISLGSICV